MMLSDNGEENYNYPNAWVVIADKVKQAKHCLDNHILHINTIDLLIKHLCEKEYPQSRLNNIIAIMVYHEKQEYSLCAQHALNNLLQGQVFSQASLDAICEKLGNVEKQGFFTRLNNKLFNPHRSMFGIGYYDVNVLILALNSQGFDVEWFDARKPMEQLHMDRFLGFICNVMTTEYWSLWKGRHWFAIREVDGIYYNLDSQLSGPMRFSSEESLRMFLAELISTNECTLLLVKRATPNNLLSSEPSQT